MNAAYSAELLDRARVWRHVKTQSHYVVLGVARCSTNGEREGKERSVVYFSMTHNHLCYREVGEFLDGRFEPLTVCTRDELREVRGRLEGAVPDTKRPTKGGDSA